MHIPRGTEFLAEFKTHNDKSFKELRKLKVKESKPVHYSQMQTYMGYLGLIYALYVAYNKNDSEYYFEIVYFDEEHFSDLKRKEAEVLMSETLLPRIGNNNSTWFECKLCSAKDVCFGKEVADKNCRTCKYVDVLPEGEWGCAYYNETNVLTVEGQRAACEKYELSEIFK
jgi:hypothetical protein